MPFDYSVIVSNAYGVARSEAAIVTIAPSILFQPSSQAVFAGAAAGLSVGVVGSGPLSYQWQFNGDNILGATNAFLCLRNFQTVNAGPYTVLVSNGSGAITSQVASVSARAAPRFPLTTAIASSHSGHHSLALKSDGTVWSWGANNAGQLGNGATNDSSVPIQVPGITNAIAVAAGGVFSLALCSDGTVLDFGGNEVGQLGNGTTNTSQAAVRVPGLSNIIGIAAGASHCLALDTQGSIWAWGYGAYGQLGNGATNNCLVPTRLPGPPQVVAISAGAMHSLALGYDGTLFGWGSNSGRESNPDYFGDLVVVPAAWSGNRYTAASAGEFFSLALGTDGIVWATGRNYVGETGTDPSAGGSYLMQPVPHLGNVVAISAGGHYSLALKGDGTVWAWGGNLNHELGNLTTNNSWLPVRVENLSSSAAISAGFIHSLALKSDASTWSWGSNGRGQLGDDTLLDPPAPVAVEGLTILPPGVPNPVARSTRFRRGHDRYYDAYNSFVVPLDFQKGVKLYPSGGNADVLFKTNAWNQMLNHINLANTAAALQFESPIVAFGSRVGGSSLYYNQNYRFGVYAGEPSPNYTNALAIEVYSKPSFAYVDRFYVPIPDITQTNEWMRFLTNGYTTTVSAYGLATTLAFGTSLPLWNVFATNGAFHLTHFADAYATNFLYLVKLSGRVGSTNLVTGPNGEPDYSKLYTLEFETPAPGHPAFVSQPQFDRQPLPPYYQGKSLDELLVLSANVTAQVPLNPQACTNLDLSPELRRHPILDQFVSDMGNDPLALANYVLNEIDLTDELAYNDQGPISEASVNEGGVNRDALAVYQEGQGSPLEQCALLIYLLRRAGVPACYIFPRHNGLLMLDARLSKLLRTQLRGAVNDAGQPVVPGLVPVNYPWVAAYIGSTWVHVFPWLKDTEIVEGLNLYDYLPPEYNNAYKWITDYVYAKPNIMSLVGSDGDDTPAALFPKFIEKSLRENHPGISIDALGVQIVNRRHRYSHWSDFPTPTLVTNQVIAVESLGSSSITNVSPQMTNIFDTVRIDAYSVANTNTLVSSGELRMSDIHNRTFYLHHEPAGGSSYRMVLSLAPYRPDATNSAVFSHVAGLNPADSTIVQALAATNTLDTSDDSIVIRSTYKRHRALSAQNYTNGPAFLNLYSINATTNEAAPIRKGDLAAICYTLGRVPRAMMDPHTRHLQELQQNASLGATTLSTQFGSSLQGELAYLLGLTFWQSDGSFRKTNERLHKACVPSSFGFMLSKLAARRISGQLPAGPIDFAEPNVDVRVGFNNVFVLNMSVRPDSSDDVHAARFDFFNMWYANSSALEHHTIDAFFAQAGAVSTVRLLQLATKQLGGTNLSAPTNRGPVDAPNLAGSPGILVLDANNYIDQGNSVVRGSPLKVLGSGIWSQVIDAFTLSPPDTDPKFSQVLITAGLVTNATGSYRGMGAMFFPGYSGGRVGGALISLNMRGGWGATLPPNSLGDDALAKKPVQPDASGSPSIGLTAPTPANPAIAPDGTTDQASASVDAGLASGAYIETPTQSVQQHQDSELLEPVGSTASANITLEEVASAGSVGAPAQPPGEDPETSVAEPVNSVTGEFYLDATDLILAGPMPLEVRRNYSSLNLAQNQFGYGWKFTYMPFLSVSLDTNVIYAADTDGAVVAYSRSVTNQDSWLADPALNPQLNNHSKGGIGGTANTFNSRIKRQVIGTGTYYTLTKADGSVRSFQVMTFVGAITKTRPYLVKWRDNRGNFYTFEYGTDSSQPDYSQLRRVQSSNGASLVLYYDDFGHITEAAAGDGRRVQYQYDSFGDLTKVTLPDTSEISFDYAHATMAITNSTGVTNLPYSTHLLTQETKPGGRVLINMYDDRRRVTNQLATVGQDLNPILNATFVYRNNYSLSNSFTTAITGYTLVYDVFNHPIRYDYTNGLIIRIADPLSQTIEHVWYPDNATAPGYPRSLYRDKDKRGLWTQYEYDGNGNVTKKTVTGDLTGLGNATEQAAWSYRYDTNNLQTLAVDPIGNSVQTVYDAQYAFLPAQRITLAGDVPISTNTFLYYDTADILTNGLSVVTNRAFGLLRRQVRADGAPEATVIDWAYDGRGYVTAQIKYTGNADPNVTNLFAYSARGELIEQADAAGRKTKFDYDPRGNLISRETFEAGQSSPMDWNYSYYNDNGELTWSDGPRYNPEDYIWRDYDGAGRMTQEIRWRSRAKADGTGVEAETGDALYATTFYQYDGFGNLVQVTDPRGIVTTNAYDALGQLTGKTVMNPDGTTAAMELYGYEPGGLVSSYVNPLGGMTRKNYTSIGKLETQINSDGSTNSWRYYLDGRIQREVQSNGSYWETVYDDVNRSVTRTFKRSDGTVLASEVKKFDRRGNLVTNIDVGGYTFTTTYDGLDRVKSSTGPAASASSGQQVLINLYDAAGVKLTRRNALGEQTTTVFDALQRPVRAELRDAGGNLVRVTTTGYSADHNSVTITEGTGTNAVTTTAFTDTFGNPVLMQGFPAAGAVESVLNSYDAVGNLTTNRDELNKVTSYTYDTLNRVASKTLPDGAVTILGYNPLGGLTNRAMPGGLTWSAKYDQANRLTAEQLSGGGLLARNFTYQYYTNGAFVGLLQGTTDPRGITQTRSYDDWLRLQSVSSTGPQPAHNLSTQYAYDNRGLVVSLAQVHPANGGGPSTQIDRQYDGYGQLLTESVRLGTNQFSSFVQTWDAAGRRTGLQAPHSTYALGFNYRADGRLTGVSDAFSSVYNFAYGDNGLLNSRSNPWRTWTVDARDGRGRMTQATTYALGFPRLVENMAWRANSTLAAYAKNLVLQTFSYNLRGQLTNESFMLGPGQPVNRSYGFDSAGLGVRTSDIMTGASAAQWQAAQLDGLMRVQQEGLATAKRTARGTALGAASVSVTLDGQPQDNVSFDPNSTNGVWQTDLTLRPGPHTLVATAHHPSGMFNPSQTNQFTVRSGDIITNVYDAAGNVTVRSWGNGIKQQLTWDAANRLVGVMQVDGLTNGFSWTAVYDGLGRRLQTQYTPLKTGLPWDLPLVLGSYYDPMVEFLEVGVAVNGVRTWKVYGPDKNGSFGGLQGIGGLEATIQEADFQLTGLLNDFFGNVIASVNKQLANINWSPIRLSGYGPLPGSSVAILSPSISVAQATRWQGKRTDPTGFYYFGARYYEPTSALFLSSDPLGHNASMDLYSYAHGDAVNFRDPDGRGKRSTVVAGDAWLQSSLSNPEVPKGMYEAQTFQHGEKPTAATFLSPLTEPILTFFVGEEHAKNLAPIVNSVTEATALIYAETKSGVTAASLGAGELFSSVSITSLGAVQLNAVAAAGLLGYAFGTAVNTYVLPESLKGKIGQTIGESVDSLRGAIQRVQDQVFGNPAPIPNQIPATPIPGHGRFRLRDQNAQADGVRG